MLLILQASLSLMSLFFPLQECFQTSSKYLSQETFKSNLLFEKNLGNVIILIYYKVDIYLFIYLLGNWGIAILTVERNW